MTNQEAINIITNHLHECAMLMPIEWLRSHSDGTPFYEAFGMALDALRANQWIPVEADKPNAYISVLGYDPTERPLPPVHECYIDDDGKWHSSVVYGMPNVTHWRPMPEKELAVE